MFPDSPYAHPVGSFQVPVPVPSSDPDKAPMVKVCVNSEWIPYIAGSLKQLLLQATWDTSDPDVLALAQMRAFNLIYQFSIATLCEEQAALSYEEFIDMPSFREDCDCNLFYKCCDGTEKQIAIASSVPPSQGTGGSEPQPPPNGGVQSYCKVMNANNVSLIPALLNTGDVITLQSADGSGYDGTGIVWYCSDGNVLFVTCQSGTGHLDGTDPLPTSNHMSLVVKIGSSFYPIAVGSPLSVPSGVANAQGWIQVNDSALTDNLGSYTLCYSIQNNQSVPTCDEFDLKTTSGGFTQAATGDAGSWVAGTGWVTGDVSVPGSQQRRVNIHKVLAENVTKITMTFDLTIGHYHLSTDVPILIIINGTPVATIDAAHAVSGSNQTITVTGTWLNPDIDLIVASSIDNTSPPVYDGSATITHVEICHT